MNRENDIFQALALTRAVLVHPLAFVQKGIVSRLSNDNEVEGDGILRKPCCLCYF